MKLNLSESSWLSVAYYDINTQALVVTTKDGNSYTHDNVTADVAFGFEKSDSPGQFYNENLKVNDVTTTTEVEVGPGNVGGFVVEVNNGRLNFEVESLSAVFSRLAELNLEADNVTVSRSN